MQTNEQKAKAYFRTMQQTWEDRAGPHMSIAWDQKACRETADFYRLAIEVIEQREAHRDFVASVTSHMREGH